MFKSYKSQLRILSELSGQLSGAVYDLRLIYVDELSSMTYGLTIWGDDYPKPIFYKVKIQ